MSFRKIDLRKPCTVESKSKNSLKDSMDKYYSDVSKPQGASFFAICRGKVSEGLDFANDNGRAVVIIGLPYPPAKDPRVNEKMDFLQALRAAGGEKVMDGQKWYRLQAIRAVNQAIGRIIRHRYDYGAIMLLDYRYADHDNFSELPKWIRPRMVEFDDAEKALRRLKSFFCSIREKEKVRLRSINSVEETNVSSKSTEKSDKPTSLPKSGNIFFGVSREKSDLRSPYFSQSTNPAMKTNKTFLSIPKANDPSNHIPPSIVANLASRPQVTPGESCSGCPEPAKKRHIDNECDSYLVPIKNARKKPKSVSLFDALSNTKNDSPKPKIDIASAANMPATNIVREMLIHNKMLDDQRRSTGKRKIKIIPNKPNTLAVNKPINVAKGLGDPPVCSKDETQWDEKSLIHGDVKIFRSCIQKAVKPDFYPNFKELLAKARTAEVSTIVSELGKMLNENDNSKIVLRAFVRFIKNPKRMEEFSVKCMEVTGRRPLGF